MRMSCNGCRVLRKGCSEDCSIRPCLQWLKNPEHQANATVFLAKFYGRAGLLNLLKSGPDHLRPAVFRSLLYEACGRIVNPVYGSVGLLWSGNWHLCQSAVDAVLRGAPIDAAGSSSSDIRHVPRGRSSHRLAGRNPSHPSADLDALRLLPSGSLDSSSGTGSICGGSDGGAGPLAAVELDLTLGFEAAWPCPSSSPAAAAATDAVDLALELAG